MGCEGRKEVTLGEMQVREKNGKESQDQGQRTQTTERTGKESCRRGGRRLVRKVPKDLQQRERAAPQQKASATAPVCSANSASISWAGLEGREATSGASRTVLSRPGRTWGVQAVGLGLPKGPEKEVGCVEGQDRRLLGRL